MQFTTTIFATLAALATIATAGTVHFVNQDNTTRTIVFTPTSGFDSIKSLTIQGLSNADQTFPTGWIGNWFAVSKGAENTSGMLGEVCFDSWGGMTYFDVSAIVNPDDINGVKELFPLGTNAPVSGCQTFPCDNAYNKWDDVQTKATNSNHLVCLLGNQESSKRSVGTKFTKEFVTGGGSA